MGGRYYPGVVGLITIGLVVLTRYPKIFNFSFMLTEHNVQRQYKNAAQMLAWIALSSAFIMLVMTGSWLGVLSINWIWAPLMVMIGASVFSLWRLSQLR